MSAPSLRYGPLVALASGFFLAFAYLGNVYMPDPYVTPGDRRYSRLDRVIESVLDPHHRRYYEALQLAARTGEKDPWNWLVLAAHFDQTGRSDIAYLLKEQAYLQSAGKLEHWGSLKDAFLET
jgi:hypothetical protein